MGTTYSKTHDYFDCWLRKMYTVPLKFVRTIRTDRQHTVSPKRIYLSYRYCMGFFCGIFGRNSFKTRKKFANDCIPRLRKNCYFYF